MSKQLQPRWEKVLCISCSQDGTRQAEVKTGKTQVMNQDNYHNYLIVKTALEESVDYHWVFSKTV